ncbi:MAG: hypothetical protein HY885_05695 [Deltaproteobacteria bacterium]|nr:hypothetical protein [Deltaproteobacteria bacterium]
MHYSTDQNEPPPESTEKAVLLQQEASLLFDQGDCEASRDKYQEAGEIYFKSGNGSQAGVCFRAAANCSRHLQDFNSAVRLYEKAGDAYHHAEESQLAARCYRQAADFSMESNEVEQAARCYMTAGQQFQSGGNLEAAASCFRDAGTANMKLGGHSEWQPFLNAAECYARAGDHENTADAYCSAAECYAAQKNYEKESAGCYRKAKVAYGLGGNYDRAGAMHYLEMKMEHRRMKPLSRQRFLSWLYDMVCGYGESGPKVIGSSIAIILVFALIYATDKDMNFGTPQGSTWSRLAAAVYFSVITFTTVGYGDITPTLWARPFAMTEAFIGAFMIALFVLVFSRKVMR